MVTLFPKCYRLYSKQQGQKVSREKDDSLILCLTFTVEKKKGRHILPQGCVPAPTYSCQPRVQSMFQSVTGPSLALLLASHTEVELPLSADLFADSAQSHTFSYCLIMTAVSKLLIFKYTFPCTSQKKCQPSFPPPEKGF